MVKVSNTLGWRGGPRLRLGFYYHIPAAFGGDGRVVVPTYLGRFLEGLARALGPITAFFHESAGDKRADFALAPDLVTGVNLGPKPSAPMRSLFAGSILRQVKEHLGSLDAFLVRGPSPLLPSLVSCLAPLPTALLLVGEYLKGVDDLPQPRWRKEVIRLWTHSYVRQEAQATRRCFVFTNSPSLGAKVAQRCLGVKVIRTTTLYEDEFRLSPDTCKESPVRLFYAGRFDRQKGLPLVLEAMALLEKRGIPCEFRIAGWEDSHDPVLNDLHVHALALGLSGRLIHLGYRPAGPELLALYREADLFITASRAWEGFPRTIWEAMSQGLPVVATRVGGIPEVLEDGVHALLVEPGDPLPLADAVERVVLDGDSRRRRVGAAYRLALGSTLEASSRQLAEGLRRLVAGSTGETGVA